jgi:EmrB/QacA subfamily drug resistance transporter
MTPVVTRDGSFTWTSRHTVALLVVCLAQLLELIDITIVNVTLPTIRQALGFSPAGLSWVVNAYVVPFGGLLLLGGRCGDLMGRRKVFLAGIAVFTMASLASGLAQGAEILVLTRGLQGLSAAFVSPMTLAIIASTFPDGAPRNRALAIWAGVSGVSGSLGVTMGGLLASGPGWRWIFFVNIPVGLFILVAGRRCLDVDHASREHRSFDVTGAVTVTAGVTVGVYGVSQTSSHPWSSAPTIILLAVAGVLLGSFVLREARFATEPLIPISLLRDRPVMAANIVSFLVGGGMFSLFYFFSLYQQEVLHYSALKTGIAYLPLTGMLMVCAAPTPLIIARTGVRWPLAAGGVISAAGMALFATDTPAGGMWRDVIGPSLVVAPGLALTFVPMTVAAVAGVPLSDTGIASGLANVSRTIGGALGLAVIVTLAAGRTGGQIRGGTAADIALGNGYRLGFAVSACLLGASAAAAVALFRNEGRGTRIDLTGLAGGPPG